MRCGSRDVINIVLRRCLAVQNRPVTTAFSSELSGVLERLSTLVDSLYVASDCNIRLDREFDLNEARLCELLAGFGLCQHVRGTTDDAGGTLDVV